MIRVFTRSHEREKSFKIAGACLFGSILLTIPTGFIFRSYDHYFRYAHIHYWFWVFSIILESVCILPQLLLLRQTNIPTVIDSFYLLTLGSYRALYFINWIYRGAKHQSTDAVSIIFGAVQTVLYLDFAWVYYTRQRVKLRAGGIVDSDDMSRGWIIQRLLGTGKRSFDAERNREANSNTGFSGDGYTRPEENDTAPASRSWGARGISVSADEGVLEDHTNGDADVRANGAGVKRDYRDERGAQADETRGILEGTEDDEDDGLPLPATSDESTQEWRN
jgi:ER lumen protein retaining receptor